MIKVVPCPRCFLRRRSIMPKIFIDPGHGGKDTGAFGSRLQEKEITLSIALEMRRIL